MELLETLWGSFDRDDAIALWFLNTKKSLHIPFRDLSGVTPEMLEKISGRTDTYFNLSAMRLGLPEDRRGTRTDVTAISCVAFDIDAKHSDPRVHVAKDLPETYEDLMLVLECLPAPTAIVWTGHGWQVYFALHAPLELTSESLLRTTQGYVSGLQTKVAEYARKVGNWRVDELKSLNHLFRLPGTFNCKVPEDMKPVHILSSDKSIRHELKDIGKKLGVKTHVVSRLPKTVPESVDLDKLRDELGRYRKNKEYVPAIKKLLKGESFEDARSRNNTRHAIGSLVGTMRSDARPKELAEIFRPSLAVWASEPSATKTVEEEMALVIDDIRRAQIACKEEQEKNRQFTTESAKAFGFSIEADDEASLEAFIKTSIIQHENSYYIRCYTTKKYIGPVGPSVAPLFIKEAFRDAPPGVSTTYTAQGVTKDKTIGQLALQYGTGTVEVVCDLTLQESFFDIETKIFYAASTPRRYSEARFDSKIDEYLRVLGGPHYPILCRWLAAFSQLRYPICCLYLEGNMSVGKDLFGLMLASVYGAETPVDFAKIYGNFNAGMERCPVVAIHEALPSGATNVSGQIRQLIGAASFQVNAKNMPLRSVKGCIRLVVLANNPNVLDSLSSKHMTQADIDAITGRILHIKAMPEAAQWLRDNNGSDRKLTDSWIADGLFAMHVLHLEKTIKLDYSKRFLVEGEETEVHRNIMMQGERNDWLYEWIVRNSEKPKDLYERYKNSSNTGGFIIGSGEILVSASGVFDNWDIFGFPEKMKPSIGAIGRALKSISIGRRRLGKRGNRTWYHSLSPRLLIQWNSVNDVCDEEVILHNLRNDVDSLAEIDEGWNVVPLHPPQHQKGPPN